MERAKKLSLELDFGTPASLDSLPSLLTEADIIISATAATSPIITKKQLAPIIKKRRAKPIFITDMAIPRDIEESVSYFEDVFLFQLDDLQKHVDKNIRSRKKAMLEAKSIVNKYSIKFLEWKESTLYVEAIKHFEDYTKSLIKQELQRARSQKEWKNIMSDEEKCLSKLLNSIIAKMTSDVAISIHNKEDRFQKQELANNIVETFTPSSFPPLKRKQIRKISSNEIRG